MDAETLPEAGRILIVERAGARGAMPPLHARDVEEVFHVLAGEVSFFVDGEQVVADAGSGAVAPAGAARTFRVESERARWLVSTRVRCAQSYESFARALSPDWRLLHRPSAPEEATLAALGRVNGITVLGPPGLLPEDLSRA